MNLSLMSGGGGQTKTARLVQVFRCYSWSVSLKLKQKVVSGNGTNFHCCCGESSLIPGGEGEGGGWRGHANTCRI